MADHFRCGARAGGSEDWWLNISGPWFLSFIQIHGAVAHEYVLLLFFAVIQNCVIQHVDPYLIIPPCSGKRLLSRGHIILDCFLSGTVIFMDFHGYSHSDFKPKNGIWGTYNYGELSIHKQFSGTGWTARPSIIQFVWNPPLSRATGEGKCQVSSHRASSWRSLDRFDLFPFSLVLVLVLVVVVVVVVVVLLRWILLLVLGTMNKP